MFLAGELHSGRLAVLAIWQHLFDGKYDFRYEAEALEVEVARSGEIGWAIGTVRHQLQTPRLGYRGGDRGSLLHVWRLEDQDNGEPAWRLTHAASLVVHPRLGSAREPRSGLMTAWPELADQIGAEIDIRWQPSAVHRAESGEQAFSFGEYETSFTPAAGKRRPRKRRRRSAARATSWRCGAKIPKGSGSWPAKASPHRASTGIEVTRSLATSPLSTCCRGARLCARSGRIVRRHRRTAVRPYGFGACW